MNAWFEAAQFSADVQRVIALRMLRLAGGGALAASEARRMTAEKFFASLEAQGAVAAAIMSGNSHKSMASAYRPYRRRLRANRRRLGG